MTPEKTSVFLTNLAKRSHVSLQQQIKAGQISSFRLVATSSKTAIIEP
jgi:hypothetical protein